VGAFFGGPLGDRFGRKYIIWFSILGALPFTLALAVCRPVRKRGADGVHRPDSLVGNVVDHRVRAGTDAARFGMISGVFFGVAFGIGGLGAALLGKVADHTGIAFVYQVCAFLPAIGLLAIFLPKMPKHVR